MKARSSNYVTFRVPSKFLFLALTFTSTFSLCGQWVSAFQSPEYEHANLAFYRDKSGVKQRVQTAEDWGRRREQILQGFQKAAGDFPAKRTPISNVEVVKKKSHLQFQIQTLKISATDEPDVYADLYVPNQVTKQNIKAPAILALHPTGAAGKKIIGDDQPKKNRQYANELASRGYVVIAPDYPSFGDLKGFDFSKDRFPSGTMRGIVNHLRCVDYLESHANVDKNRIGVIGHSLGGHNAIFSALFDERLKVIVTSCGWTPFHDYYGGQIKGWTSDRYMPRLKTDFDLDPDKVPFDFYELIAALAPRPFFTNSPINDSNFDIEGVKKAMPKIGQVYSLFRADGDSRKRADEDVVAVYPPCAHDFPSEIREQSYSFIDQVLEHQPAEKTGFKSELPRIQPLDTDGASKTFNRKDLSLVASEPNVVDPVAMAFDANQKLYVVEMIGYSEQDNEQLGRIRILEDKNRDGVYEKSKVFAKGFSWPTAIICYDGGVFVGAAPDIFYLKDTDEDGIADVRKKVFTGFGRHNVQGLLNSFRWGLDNRIHGATSSCGGVVQKVGEPETAINLRGRDFSFDPRTLNLRSETGGAQHGMCFDDWGRKFVCSNSDHAQMVRFDDRYLARNPYFTGIPARKSIAVDGGQATVYRSSSVEPWRIVRTRLRVAGRVPGPVEGGGTAAGYFTGSTGITIYRGDAKSVKVGTAIIGDVGSNIIHRKRIDFDGLKVTATRIDPMSELVTSSDNWFRPVQFANSPDGTLHILDMYREVIEHPKSLPPQIKQHLDLTSGRDRGRIYRLGKPKLKRAWKLNRETNIKDLVDLLNHPNSWHRETAMRLIFERQDVTAVQFLQTVRVKGFGPKGRMLALYALAGLKRLKLDDLMIACQDSHPQVRRHAILLAEKTNPAWLEDPAIRKLVDDPDAEVKLQLAFSMGESKGKYKLSTLWRLLRKSNGDPLMMTAIMSSANGLQMDLLKRAVESEALAKAGFGKQVVASLVQQIVRSSRGNKSSGLVEMIRTQLENEQSDLADQLIDQFVDASPAIKQELRQDPVVAEYLKAKVDLALKRVADDQQKESVRLASFPILELSDYEKTESTLLSLIDVRQPVEVQKHALAVLCGFGKDKTADDLIKRGKNLGRLVQESVKRELLSRKSWTKRLLDTGDQGLLTRSDLQLIAKSSDRELQGLAKKRLAAESIDRAAVLREYQKSLSMLGDPDRGRAVFKEHCSKCHRAGNIGFEIGPNLATMKTRGKAAILANVLDPNREVNPAFVNYIVNLDDGRTVNGMIKSESSTAVVLQQAEQKTVTLLREEIEQLKNTGLSLMPDGLEKEITPTQMADLMEFLMTAK